MATNNSNNSDRKFNQLLHSIEMLVDVVEKRGRANRSSSMYHVSSMDEGNTFKGNRKSLSSSQFNKTIDEFVKDLQDKLADAKKELGKINKTISDTQKFNSLSYYSSY